MCVASIHASPAEMFRKPRRFGPLHQFLQPPEVLTVRLLRRAEIHRDAVLYDFVLLEDLIQNVQRPSAVDHEILRDDFKPADDRLPGQNMIVVRGAQPDPDTILGEIVESIRGHFSPIQREEGGQRSSPAPKQDRLASGTSLLGRLLFFWHLGAVGCATTLALAGVLAFAAVVAGLATALALARVLAFTGVLFLHLLVVGLLVLARVLILRAERRLQRGKQGRSLDCCTGPGDQSCERRTSEQGLCRLCHLKNLLSIRVRNTIRTLFPSRGSPISLSALTKPALFDDSEAALNARTMVFATLKKSQEASKGFRDFRPEMGCETPDSEIGGSQGGPKIGLNFGLSRLKPLTNRCIALSHVHRATCKAVYVDRWKDIFVSCDRREED